MHMSNDRVKNEAGHDSHLVSDPEHRRDEAIKETISLLQGASGKTSLPDDDIPAAVWFNRATDLSNKLVIVRVSG